MEGGSAAAGAMGTEPVGSGRALARKLLALSLPMMAGSLIETLYNLTDAFFLGKLGAAEIGAPSVTFSILFFLIIFGTGLSNAGTTLMAQSRGMGDQGKMNHYLNQSASLLGLAAAVLVAAGLALSAPVLSLLGTPPETYGHALVYLRIVLLGVPFTFAYFLLQSGFVAIGDTMTPLRVHLAAVLLNVALDPLFIYGPGPFPAWGVAGAAVATVLSQTVGAVLSLAILAKGRGGLRLSPALAKPVGKSWKLLLGIGLPSSLGQAVSALGFTVLQGVVNRFGVAAIAAFGIGNRLNNMFDIPAHGIVAASTGMVGRAMGARDQAGADRIIRTSLILVLALELPLMGLAFLFGGDLVRFFVDDPEAVRLGRVMFTVITPSLLMFGLYMALTGAFQGAGDTKVIMALSITRLWVIRVPLAYALAGLTDLGPMSIWIAMFVSNFTIAVAGWLYWRSGRWRKALDPGRI